jgi:hypothetical protein
MGETKPLDVGSGKRRHKVRYALLVGITAAASIFFTFALVEQTPLKAGKHYAFAESDLPKTAFSMFSRSNDDAALEQAVLGPTGFGQFPPQTEAERELEKMLRGKEEAIDLALANWLIAADVPNFADMTREWFFRELDRMIDRVRREMARMEGVARSRGQNPNDPDTRCAIFCNAVIKLQFDYTEEFRQQPLTPLQNKAFHADPNNTFLAGLLRTRRGSCVSMPLIYLVIGQRLGFPIHLVALGDHYFVRWEGPGYRMNIEATRVDKVWVTDDDSAYIESLGLTNYQLRGSDLRNLSNREVVGQLFFERSAYWAMTAARSRTRSWADLSRALHLSPDDPAIARTHQGIFARYGITAEDTFASLKQKAHEEN